MTTNYMPILMCDFYKVTHQDQYNTNITFLASYYTPRLSRLKDIDRVTFFGAQAFCKTYLIEAFDKYFFSLPEEDVIKEYNRVLAASLGPGTYNADNIAALHRLGYLPIEVRAVPEGTRTAIGVPQMVITNTHPDFAWVGQALESLISSYFWHIQVAAEVGIRYRKIADKWADRTCDDNVDPARLISDFSMRGQHSPESAITSSGAWLLSHLGSATVPAIMWLEDNYNCDCAKEPVGFGAVSTEHSVMCSNYAIDGDEITFIKRLLTEIYPNISFSMVSDSYDYWNLVTNLIPQCKKEIENHNGTLLVRGDSGNPVEILAGKKIHWLPDEELNWDDPILVQEYMRDFAYENEIESDLETYYFAQNNRFYKVDIITEWNRENGPWTDNDYYFIDTYNVYYKEIEPTAELLGTVWALAQTFGTTINGKGYKVLPSYIKAIYGDSIIPDYAEEIYSRLEKMGFAANNVVLGAGSLSMMALVTQDSITEMLQFAGENRYTNPGPYTRDTFGFAIKATYAELKDGTPIPIFKQPKEASWKKSQKGCCIVAADGQSYTDGRTWTEAIVADNLLQPIFKDGKMIKEYTLAEIRERLKNEY